MPIHAASRPRSRLESLSTRIKWELIFVNSQAALKNMSDLYTWMQTLLEPPSLQGKPRILDPFGRPGAPLGGQRSRLWRAPSGKRPEPTHALSDEHRGH